MNPVIGRMRRRTQISEMYDLPVATIHFQILFIFLPVHWEYIGKGLK
jgi:hypothetical protein